jgi:hypothetical protein
VGCPTISFSNLAVRVFFAAEIQQEISAAWWWQTMPAKQQPPRKSHDHTPSFSENRYCGYRCWRRLL